MQELSADTVSHLNCPRCYAVFLNRFAVCPLDGTPLTEMQEDLLVGKTIAGRYVVEAFVGEGGMGRVYRARHVALSRRFAIKILFGEYAAEQKARARFAREAESASRLNHPNVVPVLDFGETDTRLPYLAMDFVEGLDLLALLDRERRLELGRVLRLAKDMCLGLAHAHARGLVHRDFKPGNVLLVEGDDGQEVPRIADFGLAIDPGELDSRLTTGRVIFGSPAYMSPEQASQGELDARSDQFSLGVTLFELLSGRLPFSGGAIDQLTQNASARRPSLNALSADLHVPERVDRLVHKLMEIWPDARFADMDEVRVEIEQIEGDLALIKSGQTIRTSAPPHSEEAKQLGVAPTTPVMSSAEMRAANLGQGEDSKAVLTHLVSRDVGASTREPERRRRQMWLAVGLVALLGSGLGVYMGVRSKPPLVVAPPIDLSGVALGAVDAGVVALAPGDAAVAGAEMVLEISLDDAAVPVGKPRPGRPVKPPVAVVTRPDAGVAVAKPEPVTVKPVEPAVPPPGAITAKSFTDYYRQVGQALERLRQQRGEEASEPFKKRYFAIPLNDALRTPALRADVMKQLVALERDIRSALAAR